MMSSISCDSDQYLYYDVESNSVHTKTKYGEILKLKGILKKDDPEEEKRLSEMLNFISMMGIILLSIPIIFCDIYYSFTDDSCVDLSPDNLKLNLKMYLLVSVGFNIVWLILVTLSSCYLPSRADVVSNRQITKVLILVASFINLVTFTNNIMGSVIFWGSLYTRQLCSSDISTYIFISLIIKFIANIRHALIPFVYSNNL